MTQQDMLARYELIKAEHAFACDLFSNSTDNYERIVWYSVSWELYSEAHELSKKIAAQKGLPLWR